MALSVILLTVQLSGANMAKVTAQSNAGARMTATDMGAVILSRAVVNVLANIGAHTARKSPNPVSMCLDNQVHVGICAKVVAQTAHVLCLNGLRVTTQLIQTRALHIARALMDFQVSIVKFLLRSTVAVT